MSILKNKKNLAAAFLGSAAVLLAPNAAEAKLYVFGDSFSDTGNIKVLTNGVSPGPSYYDGRFTNGWTWAERLSSRLDNSPLGTAPGLNRINIPAGASGGVNFAHAGATSTIRPGLQKQLNAYQQAGYFAVRRASLGVNCCDIAAIWAGVNDYLAYNVNDTSPAYAMNSSVLALSKTGLGRILVLNLPYMGNFPGWIDSSDRNRLNTLTVNHNRTLATLMTRAQTTTPVKIIQVDIARAIDLAQQGVGGFTIVRSGQNGSVSGNCLGDGKVLSACTDNYLYYDYIHFSRSGHEYITGIVQDRLLSSYMTGAPATLNLAGAASSMAAQQSAISARLAAAQDGIGGVMSFGAAAGGGAHNFQGGASGVQGLSLYGYGSADGFDDGISLATDDQHDGVRGFGADWRAGDILAGVALFQAKSGDAGRQNESISVERGVAGFSVYAAATDGASTFDVTMSATGGDQRFRRATAISSLPWATGETHVTSQSLSFGASKEFAIATSQWRVGAEARVTMLRTAMDAFQETGTMGLSDNFYEAREDLQTAGRIGLSLRFDGDGYGGKIAAHYLTALDGGARPDVAAPFSSGRTRAVHLADDHAGPANGASIWGSAWIDQDDALSFRAEGGAITTSDGTDAVLQLSGVYKF